MASNSPFHMEDQTDEDFFDKLVDDDYSPNEAISSSSSATAVKFIDDNESDEAKAFANLSIGEDSREEYKSNEAKPPGHDSEDVGATVSVDAQADKEPAASLVATEALDVDSGGGPVHPINQGDLKNVLASESTGEIENDNSEGVGIKEVGWNSFYADTPNNGVHGVGSYSDFFSELGENAGNFHENAEQNVFGHGGDNITTGFANNKTVGPDNSISYGQYLGSQDYGKSVDQSPNSQNLGDSQNWENMYPGWKYDSSTGQWVHVDGQDAIKDAQVSYENPATDWGGVSDGKSEVAYLRQSTSYAVGTVTEMGTTESVSNLNQVSQPNNGYPEHMIFDPQYPGWYYDTIAQEWRSLEIYDASVQSNVQVHQDQQIQNGYVSTTANANDNTGSVYGEYGQIHRHTSQDIASIIQSDSRSQSHHGYNQQGISMWQPEVPAATGAALYPATSSSFGGNHQVDSYFGAETVGQQSSNFQTFEKASQSHFGANGIARAHSFVPDMNLSRPFEAVNAQHGRTLSSDFLYSQNSVDVAQQSGRMSFSSDFNDSQKSGDFVQPSYQSSQQFSYAANTGRSPDGRPAHALVAFGFGGKLIVMKDSSSSSFGSQAIVGSTVSLLNLAEVVTGDANSPSFGDTLGYFRALCQQSLPGPLIGGSVGSKEIYKWLDENIANCESPVMDFAKGKLLKLLLSLLKISCQHYGKLRSPFGADTTLKESDTPEAAVAKLFASAKNNAYGALSPCLQQIPPEAQIQATASEVQSLLVSGRKMEALRCAQDGQLWGPALIIATQLGDQFYIDTVKQIALRQLASGSPLRTLCLLIAGQPAEVFSTGNTSNGGLQGPMDVGQYHAQLQPGTNSMLDDWEENLAVIAANRTKDDELVITHLGDCLWKERSEIVAAHICYLVAEKNFEPYSDAARLCLVGADHWKFPRTYASPEAIQRTELYEYSKVLGNSQYILMPFQPYKLLYAHMLTEVGKVADALKYCQAVSKSLKTGRAPEAETWKQLVLSLEERIRIYQQGGYTANLAPAKLVGKLLNFFDNTAHRVVGGLPPPVPSTSHQQTAPRVSSSQSTMTMSSLMPSASMEPISQWAGDGSRMTVQSRSVSEPDFGRTPRQEQVPADSSKGKSGDGVSGKASDSRTASRFGRFGFGSELLKKTVGLVIRSKPSHEAKLGEQNKFYYDEKLKRWVEEGAEAPAVEAALPPPPTTSTFMSNNMSDYGNKSDLKNEMSPSGGIPNFSSPTPSENLSGVPPIPGGSNQFSARGRMGVRARYVDTFNKGRGNPGNMFQSPPAPSVKPAMPANAKFFVPAPAAAPIEQGMESITESAPEFNTASETASLTAITQQFQTPTSSSPMSLQRFPSMDNIKRSGSAANVNHSLHPSHSRRTASWSGGIDGAFSPPANYEVKPLGDALGMSPTTFTPSPLGSNSSLGEDLQEVEL